VRNVITEELRTFKGHTNFVFCLKFNKASTLLCSGSYDNTLRVWNVADGTCAMCINAHKHPVTSLDFVGKEGKHVVTSSYDGSIIIWDITTGQQVATVSSGSDPVGAVVLSPNSRYLLCASLSSRANLWDLGVAEGKMAEVKPKLLKSYSGHVNEKYCLFMHFFQDKWIVSGSEDSKIVVWNLITPDIFQTVPTQHSGPVMGVTCYGKIFLASFSMDGTICLWKAVSEIGP